MTDASGPRQVSTPTGPGATSEEVNNNIHPVVGYVRVSTVGQASDGLGLEVQRQQIEAWALEHGGVDVWHEDAGISGKASGTDPLGESLEQRPGLAQALADVSDGGTLVVAAVSRLSRDQIAQELLLRLVTAKGGRIVSTSEPEWTADDPSPTRDLIRTILGGVAAYERAIIVHRLAAGRAMKRAMGGHASGPLPWGTEVIDDRIVTAAWASPIVSRVGDMRRAGDPYQVIAGHLNRDGIQTATGGKWTARTVQRMVKQHLPDLHAATGRG